MEPHSCECFEDGPPQFKKARLLGKLLTEWVASHALTGPEPEKRPLLDFSNSGLSRGRKQTSPVCQRIRRALTCRPGSNHV